MPRTKPQIFTRPTHIGIEEWRATTVRVLRGDRWLSENVSPDYDLAIDRTTLCLTDGSECICGQVYRRHAYQLSGALTGGGYGYAKTHLFAEANHWVSKIVGAPNVDDNRRSIRTAVALGFNSSSVSQHSGSARVFKPTDQVFVGWGALQYAWEQFLAHKAAQRQLVVPA